ncbi:MAG: excinuclease ABC subunit UvrC [SAR202 cluster bacterium]|nr:MAG: excinuclease ABC subunit UvrC [SAR202 cluster bacterium]
MVKSDSFKNRLRDVPKNPGVYLHSNVKKEIIYVGKANSLQDRLKYYFSPQIDATPKIKELMNNIHDFDFIVTESEQEALLLENQLIKKYQPKYNARLKDDKSYPYIKITKSEEFPQIVISRNPKNDKNKYYGPYSSISSVRQTLDLLSKIFPYRTCTKEITGKDKKACLEFDIGRCKAPCIGNSDQAEYEEIISSVEKFLSGKTSPIVKEIKNEMVKASNAQNYERAAVYRDRIKAIERILEKQKVSGLRYETFDLISCVKIDNEAMIIVFNIRKGNMIAHEKFRIERTESTEVEEIIRLFLYDYYSKSIFIPNSILVSEYPSEKNIIKDFLENKSKKKINISIPVRGTKKKLLEMGTSNAKESLKQWQIKWINDSKKTRKALNDLQNELGLINLPNRIECFDISHIQGSNVVASMSVFENGLPKKSDYRRFKISEDKNDDFAAMREVINRRYKKLLEKKDISKKLDSFSKVPDLILIDGGKGQLSSALQVLLELGFSNIPIAGIAKREEEIFMPYNEEPIILDRSSQGLYLIQRVRDEAHRFAITYHRNIRQKKSIQSELDTINGIGKVKKKALLKKFGSTEKIKNSSIKEIATIKNINDNLAKNILEVLNSK